MGVKNQGTFQLNWQTSTPVPYKYGNQPSGVVSGVMTGTSVIYSNIFVVDTRDNQGLEITWSGTPNGTIEIMGSSSGSNFYPLTFDPLLAQPAGSPDGYLINLNQFPWRYLMVQYTNASGSGNLSAWLTSKDLN